MITIKKAKNGEFFFHITGKNGKVIVTSETYKRRAGCNKGIAALQELFSKKCEVQDETRPKSRATK